MGAEGDAWISAADRARLRLTPRWAVAEAVAEEDLFDGAYAPVYRLTLRSAPGTEFELSTRIELAAAGKGVGSLGGKRCSTER